MPRDTEYDDCLCTEDRIVHGCSMHDKGKRIMARITKADQEATPIYFQTRRETKWNVPPIALPEISVVFDKSVPRGQVIIMDLNDVPFPKGNE